MGDHVSTCMDAFSLEDVQGVQHQDVMIVFGQSHHVSL